jgi:hypothetical protein
MRQEKTRHEARQKTRHKARQEKTRKEEKTRDYKRAYIGPCLLQTDSEREQFLFVSPDFSAYISYVILWDSYIIASTVRHWRSYYG